MEKTHQSCRRYDFFSLTTNDWPHNLGNIGKGNKKNQSIRHTLWCYLCQIKGESIQHCLSCRTGQQNVYVWRIVSVLSLLSKCMLRSKVVLRLTLLQQLSFWGDMIIIHLKFQASESWHQGSWAEGQTDTLMYLLDYKYGFTSHTTYIYCKRKKFTNGPTCIAHGRVHPFFIQRQIMTHLGSPG